jgi:3-isopropylmalate/(R)-2-methylmalate dehydratase small subunit
LNDLKISGCEVLLAGRNFGCGSSREAAVYALADYGIRVVIASSFGDIFASNTVKNGVLPAQVSEEDSARLLSAAELVGHRPLTIDLAAQTITVGNLVVSFSIEPVWRKQLLNGWDDIDMTRSEAGTIARFAEQDEIRRPWMKPAGVNPPTGPRRGKNR